MNGLRLDRLVRRYGDAAAVQDLSLDIARGELVTLLGPSGCGKTTTLRMVAGFLSPDSGDIWFGDRRMNDIAPHRRDTAMVFQSYALFPHMTVDENVAFGLKMRGIPPEERKPRVEEALELVNLGGLQSRRPGQLSGGQQQRVALARAVVTRPDILLFDEPLSNLDAKLRVKVRLEIRALQRRLNVTTLYVTHDQAEAMAISDKIAVMNKGRIEQIGTPEAIYRSPGTEFVADFLGAANIIQGRNLGSGLVETAIGRLAVAGAEHQPLGAMTLSWRPEDMALATGDTLNTIDARVKSRVFYGNFTDADVIVGNQLVKAQLASEFSGSEGDAIQLHLPPSRIQILRASA